MAVSALAPSYFKPSTLDLLIASCAKIASAAPDLPFYYYDIPVLTGVNFSMPDFLAAAPARIPNFAGIKFTNPNLMMYLECLRADGGKLAQAREAIAIHPVRAIPQTVRAR